MFCTALEKAFVQQNQGRFSKRLDPAMVDAMSVLELKKAFKHVNAYMAQRLGIQLGRDGNPVDLEQFRWALKEMVRRHV